MKNILRETMRRFCTKNLLTEDREPDVVIHGNTARLIDLTSSRKGQAIYKKLDIDRVKYYQGGRVQDPVTGETVATIQRNLSDEQVIDFLYKNRNSTGGYSGFQNNLKEDKEPSDVELGKWALSAKLPDTMKSKVAKIKSSPQYKAGDTDYAQVVEDLGRKALLNAYNEK